jgi:hypothetical protein
MLEEGRAVKVALAQLHLEVLEVVVMGDCSQLLALQTQVVVVVVDQQVH